MRLEGTEQSSFWRTHTFELCTASAIGALGLGLGLGLPEKQSLEHPYDKLINVCVAMHIQVCLAVRM